MLREIPKITWCALAAYSFTYLAFLLPSRQADLFCSCSPIGFDTLLALLTALIGLGALSMHSLVKGLLGHHGKDSPRLMPLRMVVVSTLAHVIALILAIVGAEFHPSLEILSFVATPLALMALHARYYYLRMVRA